MCATAPASAVEAQLLYVVAAALPVASTAATARTSGQIAGK